MALSNVRLKLSSSSSSLMLMVPIAVPAKEVQILWGGQIYGIPSTTVEIQYIEGKRFKGGHDNYCTYL